MRAIARCRIARDEAPMDRTSAQSVFTVDLA
jgi:hypothetical protein